MSNTITITVCGNLTHDPQLQNTNDGTPYVHLNIATTPRQRDKQTNQWRDGVTTWTRATAWGDLAQNIAATLVKGSRIIVTGTLENHPYTGKDGQTHNSTELRVDEIGPSLKYATATIKKNPPRNPGGYQSGYQPANNTQNRGAAQAPQNPPANNTYGRDPWSASPYPEDNNSVANQF